MTQDQYKKLTHKDLANKLGVSERTVYETRAMMKNGGIGCLHYPNCMKEKK